MSFRPLHAAKLSTTRYHTPTPDIYTHSRLHVHPHLGLRAWAEQVMQQEHLTKLQVALREMEDRTVEIREEFAAEKQRERYMRDLTEATCSRVM